MLFQNNDFLLFTGDSVTDAGRKHPVGEGLWAGVGTGYVRYIDSIINVFFPQLQLRIANTGENGSTVRSLKERWESDVSSLSPDWLSICIGVNDVWRQFDEPMRDQVYPEEYYNTLDSLVSDMKGRTKGIFLMTPYYMEPLKNDPMRAKMDIYGGLVKEIANKRGTYFVDLQQVFDDYLKYRHSSFVAWDRVHPNGVGCMLIARAFLKAAGIDIAMNVI